MDEKLKFRCILNADKDGNFLYAVRYTKDITTVRSLINAILGQKTWGFITIRLYGGDLNIRYRGTKLLDRVDPKVLNMTVPHTMIGATGKDNRMDYLMEVKPYD